MKDFKDISCCDLAKEVFAGKGNLVATVNVKLQESFFSATPTSPSESEQNNLEKHVQEWGGMFAIASIGQYSIATRSSMYGLGCLIAWYREPSISQAKVDSDLRKQNLAEYERLAKLSPLQKVCTVPVKDSFNKRDWMFPANEECSRDPVRKYEGIGQPGEQLIGVYRFNQFVVPSIVRSQPVSYKQLLADARTFDTCAREYTEELAGMKDFVPVLKGLQLFSADNGKVSYTAAKTPEELVRTFQCGMSPFGVLKKTKKQLTWEPKGTKDTVDFSSCFVLSENDLCEG